MVMYLVIKKKKKLTTLRTTPEIIKARQVTDATWQPHALLNQSSMLNYAFLALYQ